MKAGKECRTLIVDWTGLDLGQVQGRKKCRRRVRGLDWKKVVESLEEYLFSPSRVPPFGLGFQAAAFG